MQSVDVEGKFIFWGVNIAAVAYELVEFSCQLPLHFHTSIEHSSEVGYR